MKTTLVIVLSFLVLSAFASEMDCMNAIMGALDDTEMLQSMLLNTGKTVNDLGQMDACNKDPTTVYVVLNVSPLPFFQGLCLPRIWNNENLQIIRQAIEQLAAQQGIPDPKASTDIPAQNRAPVTFGNIAGFVGFGVLFLICLFGVFVEYTDVLGRPKCPEYDQLSEGAKDKELVKSKNKLGLFFLSFSFSRNLRKTFFTPQSDKDYLSVLNGIRVLSMAYIILGHTHEILQGLPLLNILTVKSIITDFYTVVISGGLYSVDIFFFMSAFLGAYLMIQKFEGKKMLNFPMIYFHRFYRLGPTILLFLSFILTFYIYLGYGPVWNAVNPALIEPCQKYWWTTVLFINNVYPPPGIKKCHNVLWYLANDMQFFIVLPFLILAYINRRVIGYAVTIFLLMGNIVCTFTVSEVGKHNMTILNGRDATYIYHVPYTRVGAYLVGVLFGMFYFEYQKSLTNPEFKSLIGSMLYHKIHDSRVVRWSLYVVTSAVMIFLICIPFTETRYIPERTWGQVLWDFFNAFHRIIFVTAFGLWMAGPATGRTYLFRFIFGGSAWAPWAKLTFIAYLAHPFVIVFYYLQTYQGVYLTKRFAMYAFFASFLVTYIVVIPLALMIESPFLQLERLLLFPPREKQQQARIREFEKLLPIHNEELKEEERKPRRSTRINESLDETKAEAISKQ